MAFQTANNILIAYKVESVFNTPVSGGSGYQFRPNAGGGLTLAQTPIRSNEIRADGKTSIARYGSKSVTGNLPADLSLGTFDPMLEAVMRSTWVAAVVITEATAGLTSITTTSSTIVASAGSWLTAGVRVGDVIRLTNHSTAGNNSRNLRVTGVSALTLTVAETLTTDAGADSSFTVTILKKLKQGTTPTRRSFTIEEYEQDLDLTEQYSGCRVSSMRIAGGPDTMATVDFGIVGADMTPVASGASPIFTSPTLTTSIGLVLVDATVRWGGSDIAVLTGFDMSFDMSAAGQPVIGSRVTPDVFENNTVVSGTITGLRSDLTNVTRATAETELELHILLVEPESEPKDCISFFVSRMKIQVPSKGLGGNGAMIETMAFEAGTKGTATGYDDTMITISTSAA